MEETAAQAVAAPDSRSTVLDGNSTPPSGGGRPALSEPTERKPESVGDSLRASLKEIKAEEAPAADDKKAETPKVDKKDIEAVKAQRNDAPKADDQKQAKADDQIKDEKAALVDEQQPDKREPAKADAGSEQEGEGRGRAPDGRRPNPPARFLTAAKDVWANTPRSVQSEVSRMEQDHAREIETYRAQVAEYERLKPFAERAQKGGTDLPTALSRYVGMEDAFRQDPAQGFKSLLNNLQMTPQQAIVAMTRAYGVTPADLARHIQSAPDQYNALVQQQGQRPQPQPQQPEAQREDPRVAALEARLAAMETQNVATSIVGPLIERIGEERYAELEDDIVMLLNSGKIPKTLSPAERLQEAYTLADRLNPASRAPQQRSDNGLDDSDRRAASHLNGNLQVKSSLGGANDGDIAEPSGKSIRAVLEAEARRIRRA